MDPRALFRNHYAFLVGIDEYDHFGKLRGAHSDAVTLRDALRFVGYPEDNLWMVPPTSTSLSDLHDMTDGFREMLRRSRQSGRNPDVVVFWAGHGVPGDDGGFLIARNTEHPPSGDWQDCAISLTGFAERLTSVGPASLTMYFDVCHSIPSNRDDLRQFPRELILAPMRDAVRTTAVRTTFVGVSTFAYEVWNGVRDSSGRSTGILADTVQKAVRGEPFYDDDTERCHGDDFAVTDEHLTGRLKGAVSRKTREAGVYEKLFVLTHHDSSPRNVGFAVKCCSLTRLNVLQLPIEADCLMRLVMGGPEPYLDSLTEFGNKLEELARGLIDPQLPREKFVRDERELTCTRILGLRGDPHLGSYVYFLLHCREEANRDTDAKEILQELYTYLVMGGSSEELARWLESRYQMFAFRQSLPWSYGIRVLHGKDEGGYAPIVRAGAPIAHGSDAKRTFVTTSPLQQSATIEVWRANEGTLTVHDLDADGDRCCKKIGHFSTELGIGSRVWVRIGFDEQGCEKKSCLKTPCEKHYCEAHYCSSSKRCDVTDVYVPMRISLGREGNPSCDWDEHWHLKLGEDWFERRGSRGSGAEPSWVVLLRTLIDECRHALETLLLDSRDNRERHRVALVKTLYIAESVTRMRDESRLEHVAQELIAALRDKREISVPRLIGALRDIIDADAGEGPPDDQGREGAHRQDAERVLATYERWQAEEVTAPTVEVSRAELLKILLEAVIAKDSQRRSTATRVVDQLQAMGSSNIAGGTLGGVVASMLSAGARATPLRAERAVVYLISAVTSFVGLEARVNLPPEQEEMLRGWVQFANQALERGQSGEALEAFFAGPGLSIGIATALLARVFTVDAAGVANIRLKIEALLDQVREDGDLSDVRATAEEIYRELHPLHLSRLRGGQVVPSEETDLLLMLNAVLWPQGKEVVLATLTRDVDVETGFRVADAFADQDQLSLADTIRTDDDDKNMIHRIAIVDWVLRAVRVSMPRQEVREQPSRTSWSSSTTTSPTAPDQTQSQRDAQWRDQMLLAIPPEERLVPGPLVDDGA